MVRLFYAQMKGNSMADNRKYYYLYEVDTLVYCGKCHTPKQKRCDKPLIERSK